MTERPEPTHPECPDCRCAEVKTTVRVKFDARHLMNLPDADRARVMAHAKKLLRDPSLRPY